MSESGGGDVIILPARKNKEKKKKNKFLQVKKPKLSKSQQRKLKKLQEDKEKEALLIKSMETLEKYKIDEDVFSLMWSSKNLGQVETRQEKRRREIAFSIKFPGSDNPFKKTKICHAPRITELCEGEIQPPVENGEDYASPNSAITDNNKVVASDEVGILPVYEVSDELIQPAKPESQSLSPKFSSNDDVNAKHINDLDDKENQIHEKRPADCHPARDLITPMVVHVSRPADVEKQRMDLPIVMMEQEIMEAINYNNSVIICGETGCGKTTQVPQFLYEAGFGSSSSNGRCGMVGVTQPRRVAVLATARRVAHELGLRLGKEVGFQVRHDRRVGENCSIKFMTDGILLREVQSDFLLKRYSVIILDEAHERSVNTDILVGMLSRVIQERRREYEEQQKRISSGQFIESSMRIYPLKLILMSATLCVEDFLSGGRIFRDPTPVLKVSARQYEVKIHFSKKTEIVDYVGQAFKKVVSIHKRLPPGGILVFVTGQREVEHLCRRLRSASKQMVSVVTRGDDDVPFPAEGKAPIGNIREELFEEFESHEKSSHDITERFSAYTEENEVLSDDESEMSLSSEEDSDLDYFSDNAETDSKPEDALGAIGTLDSLKAAFEALSGGTSSAPHTDVPKETGDSLATVPHVHKPATIGPMLVLPLYAMLPASSQLRIFDDVKEGERLVVVATNVAETSLTIPGIKYVVDTGREKVKNYNSSNGMETYEIQWISKASASQRTGRAGRTAPGHCYRLYSSSVYNNLFSSFSKAEILKTPIDGVVLLMKSMHIGKVANFPFPTPPDRNALIEAERSLTILEALNDQGILTPLGKAMACFPMSPRHSRMLLTVIHIMQKENDTTRANIVLGYAVATAAALSLSNPFLMRFDELHNATTDDTDKVEENASRKKLKLAQKASRERFSNPTSDALSIAFALQCFELSENQVKFCRENCLHFKTMEEMSKLRKQLLQLVFSSSVGLHKDIDLSWHNGTQFDVESSWKVPHDRTPLRLSEEDILRQAICAGWADRVAKRLRAGSVQTEGDDNKLRAVRYQSLMVKETVFLHRMSSLYRSPPEYLVYVELLHTKRPYIHGATSIKSSWLVQYAGTLCSFSSSLQDPKPFYDTKADQVFSWVVPCFGQHLWELPMHPLPTKEDSERVSVFAASLLQGQVLPCIKDVSKYLVVSPLIILKPESWGQKRVGNLLEKMKGKGRVIDNCGKLRVLWKGNPKALYNEIEDWFQEKFRHQEFGKLWEKMLQQVDLEPKKRFSKKVKTKH